MLLVLYYFTDIFCIVYTSVKNQVCAVSNIKNRKKSHIYESICNIRTTKFFESIFSIQAAKFSPIKKIDRKSHPNLKRNKKSNRKKFENFMC